jgi:hypothetical protein
VEIVTQIIKALSNENQLQSYDCTVDQSKTGIQWEQKINNI